MERVGESGGTSARRKLLYESYHCEEVLMSRHSHLRTLTALATGLFLASGCGDGGSPTQALAAGSSLFPSSGTPSLVSCPSSTTQSVTGLIGALGGTLSVGGTIVTIPANAVLTPTNFTLTIPASPYMEIEVTANGADHFVFSQPVAVTIDYGRCADSSLLAPPYQAWNIDPATHTLLENMGGVDVKLTHTVVFTTIHFSGYALAD